MVVTEGGIPDEADAWSAEEGLFARARERDPSPEGCFAGCGFSDGIFLDRGFARRSFAERRVGREDVCFRCVVASCRPACFVSTTRVSKSSIVVCAWEFCSGEAGV